MSQDLDIRRDYAAEMRAVIDAETVHGDISYPEVAARIVEKLRVTDPDLLIGFLEAEAVRVITHVIRTLEQNAKAKLRQRGTGAQPRRAFAEAAAAHGDGQPARLTGWLERRFEVAQGIERKLGECTAADLDHAIGRYRVRAEANAFEAIWLEAIKKKVGAGTVADHFTDEQLAAMRGGLASS